MKKKFFPFMLLLTFLFQPDLRDLNSGSTQAKKGREALQHEVVVTLKLVQVFVTDKRGNPVTDLTKDDFILYDNGELQKITDFEKHILAQPDIKIYKQAEEKFEETKAVPPAESSLRMNRKFFLLLDIYRNDTIGVKKSKEAALHFIDTQLRPTDEVGVLSFSPYRGLILHEYLTTNHQKARQIINEIKEIPGRRGGYQGAALSVTVMRREEKEVESGAQIPPPKAPPMGFNPIEPKDFALDIRELGKALRYIPGYKNIILFSAGFARALLYNPYDTTFRELYEEMSKELATSSSPVYTVNAEGSRAHFISSRGRGDHALKMLSDISGGKYFEDVKEYKTIAEEIQNITSNYYVLGYYIDEKWDGEFHKIKVEVKQEGCQIHAQGGYFNPKPFTEFSKFEKKLQLMDLALSEKPYFQDPMRFPLVALLCSSKKESNLVLLSKIPVERIKEIASGKTEMITLILDKQNSIVDSSQGEINFSTISQEIVYHYTISALLPGQYKCRVVLRNFETGKGAVASYSVVIPEVLDTGLRLYPPLLLIPEKEAQYLRASKVRKEKKGREPLSLINIYPFLSNKHSPVVETLDQGTSYLLGILRCSVKGIQNPEVDLSAHLIQHQPEQKTPLSFSIFSSKKKEGIDILLIELKLPELKPGRYTLEITAEETTTKSRSQVVQTFKVR